MLIKKGNKEMRVSPKAFRILYKEQGYEAVKMVSEEEQENTEDSESLLEEEVLKQLSKMKVSDLKTLASEKGIEGCEDMKKEELIEVLKDVM